ncbi:MAG TPA: transketolase C-terminal domain-containing protein [Candidatus Udaeobacter sp.]|jgi:pyruvate dehydrogenase E1 component beta subunit|nr:transketolase C-terminal domain-containing protein [Candidatus Udaeobacter sp.]
MRELAYYEAKFEALHEIMAADERVHLINGTFLSLSPRRHIYQELVKKYGDRIMSTPISELGFCGLAAGAAMAGLRPIVDISTGSFIFEGWPQVCNEAANAFYMSAGQTRVPVVFHLFHGIRGGGAAQHSASPQAMLWNNPGLEIVLPSSPKDVKGLLKTAVASDNPTIFVDHVQLLEVRGEVPENGAPIPFGQADIKRKGSDVTVISTSYMVQRCLQVADKLAQEGIEAEIVDPRTLVPFDMATLITSVEKTGRVVIVDETHQSCGVAAEIAARIAESGFDKLKAPLRRVATLDVPVPYSPPLEEYIGPREDRIIDAIRFVLR